MTEEKRGIHICPVLLRTVVWENGKCTEICAEEDCPIAVLSLNKDSSKKKSKDSGNERSSNSLRNIISEQDMFALEGTVR